jgi:hypothetical protein
MSGNFTAACWHPNATAGKHLRWRFGGKTAKRGLLRFFVENDTPCVSTGRQGQKTASLWRVISMLMQKKIHAYATVFPCLWRKTSTGMEILLRKHGKLSRRLKRFKDSGIPGLKDLKSQRLKDLKIQSLKDLNPLNLRENEFLSI